VKDYLAGGVPTHNHSAPSNAERDAKLDLGMPCGHKLNGRNLVVCIDGTANQFGNKVCFFFFFQKAWATEFLIDVCGKNTNVIELYNLLLKEVEETPGQRTWYNSGIGTYARPSWKSLKYYKQALYHKIDLAIAWCVQSPISI
jgi:uncharacterized protein (DUF2235 family)